MDSKTGGAAFVQSKIIFGANDSEYYPHEVVHLYLYEYFPYANDIIEEGLATYLGGSLELDYKKHLQTLKVHLKSHKVDVLKELLAESHYTLTDRTSLMYSVGALICDLAVKKCGKQGLITLLDSGKSNEDLLLTLEGLFAIDRSGFNDFIERELRNYG
jgi:hypothetical protein